jgi:pyruvate formate lyase activating enzyme
MARRCLRQLAELSLATDGCIKFDLEAWDPDLHRALCGVDNARTLENFVWLAEFGRQRPEPPLLVASTLLGPGYEDVEEVAAPAAFIAGLDVSIPYSLLGFHPDFLMRDLPSTSRGHAEESRTTALDAGLVRVGIGNPRLLRPDN